MKNRRPSLVWHGAVTVIAGSCIAWTPAANAQEWLVAPAVRTLVEYDDNPLLIAGGEQESNTAVIITPRVRAGRFSEITRIDMGAALSFVKNDHDVIDDEEELRLALRADHRTSPLNTLNVDADFRRDTLRRDVIGADDVISDELDDVDVGLIRVDVNRHRTRISPGWQRRLTEKSSVEVGYVLNDVFYSDDEGTDLVDHTQHHLDTRLAHSWTERTHLVGVVGFSSYRPEGGGKADDRRLTGGVNHRFHPNREGSFQAGVRETTGTASAVEDDSTGFILNINYRHRTETGQLRLDAERSMTPSGLGRLVEANRLNVHWNNRLTERLSMQTRLRAVRIARDDENALTSVRDHASFEVGASWALTRELSVESRYRFRWQERSDLDVSANSNAIFVGFNYGSIDNQRFRGSLGI